MTPDDRIYFPSDVRKYNFYDYRYIYYLGMRGYLVKEILFDLDKAKRKMLIMKCAHVFVLFIYYLIIGSFVYFVLKYFGFLKYFHNSFLFLNEEILLLLECLFTKK